MIPDVRVPRCAQSARGPADSIDQRDRGAEIEHRLLAMFHAVECIAFIRRIYCAAVFIRSIRCRARKRILSPALISPDTVHRRKATSSGSMRRVLQNVSSRIDVAAHGSCCRAARNSDLTASFLPRRQIRTAHARPPRELPYRRRHRQAVG